MFTLLEYVCETVLGPATLTRGDGQSEWECPFCGSHKFHTRPHTTDDKDKWSCWKCQSWGDELDILKLQYPTYDQRLARLRTLKKKYRALVASAAADDASPAPGSRPVVGSSFRGQTGSTKNRPDGECPAYIWADLTPDEIDTLLAAWEVMKAKAPACDFEALAVYCEDMLAYLNEPDPDQDPPPKRTRAAPKPLRRKTGPTPVKPRQDAPAGRVVRSQASPATGANGKAPARRNWPPKPIARKPTE